MTSGIETARATAGRTLVMTEKATGRRSIRTTLEVRRNIDPAAAEEIIHSTGVVAEDRPSSNEASGPRSTTRIPHPTAIETSVIHHPVPRARRLVPPGAWRDGSSLAPESASPET